MARRNAQCGAALTEMIVLLFVMLPLAFAVPMIGKLVDARQTTVQASRYATWEATVAEPGARTAAQLRERFFMRSDAPLSSAATAPEAHTLWGESARAPVTADDGRHAATVRSPTAIELDAATASASAWRHDAADLGLGVQVGDALVQASKALGGDGLGVPKAYLTRADVGIDLKTNAWFDDEAIACGGVGGCLRESGVILVDGWSAPDDATAEERVKSLVPASRLERVGNLLSGLGAIPMFRELEDLDGMFGYTDLSVLPPHADHGLDVYEEDVR